MKNLAFLSAAILTFLISAASQALGPQANPVATILNSQATPESAREYLQNYSRDPFMSPERLSQVEEAMQSNDISMVNRYNALRLPARAIEQTISDSLRHLEQAIASGEMQRAAHEMRKLETAKTSLENLSKRWAEVKPQVPFNESGPLRTNPEITGQPPQLEVVSAPSPPGPPGLPGPPGPEVTTTSPPPPPPPPSVLGVSLTTPVVVTSVAVAVGVGVAVNKSGDDTTDTTGGNE